MSAPDLIVTVGSERHEFSPGSPRWSPSETGPDVWASIAGGVAEVEVSNGSIIPGDKSRTKAMLQGDVTVQAGPGKTLSSQREKFPSTWPMGRGAWRRFVIGGTDEGPSFRSDWRLAAKRYGPCDLPLPTLGAQQRDVMLALDTTSGRMVLTNLRLGIGFHVDDWDDCVTRYPGSWMPHGPPDNAGVGGTGIYFATGYRNNVADLRRAYLIAQAEHERGRRWYDRRTGDSISTESYPQNPTPDLYGYPVPPEAMIPTQPDPLPLPYDDAHMIRGFRRTLQVAEQADSPMAKRSLSGLAGFARLVRSHRGRLPVPGYTPINLAALQWQAGQAPHTGIFGAACGRQIGWDAFLVAADAKLSGWKGEAQSWAVAFLAMIDTATTPAGPIQKAKGGSGNWPVTEFTCQTFEQVILAYGCAGLAIQMGVPVPIFVHRILENIYGPNNALPMLGAGPPHYIKTAESNGFPVARLTEGVPNGTGDLYGDPAHSEAACALAASIDPNPATWVERGRLYNHAFPTWEAKRDWLTSTAVLTLDWECSLLAQMQRIEA